MLSIGQCEWELKSDRRLVYLAAGLLALSVPVGTWIVGRGFLLIDVSQLLVSLLIVIGLILYALGRDGLPKQTKINRVMAIFLFLFGGFFLSYGTYINRFAYDAAWFHVYEPLVLHVWLFNENAMWSSFLDMAWSSLWIIAGVLFIVDSLRMPPKGIGGTMLAASSLLIYWNWRGFVLFFLGYPLYLSVSVAATLLVIVGLVVSAFSIRKRITYGPVKRLD